MYKVFKYAGNVHSNEVVVIPDMDLSTHECNINCDETFKEIPPEITPQQQAEYEAKEMLDKVEQRCRNMLKQAEDEVNSIRAQAWKQGYDEAFQSQLNDIVSCLNQSNQTLFDIKNEYNNYINEYASKLSQFSLEVASSIIKKKLDIEPLVMCDLVENVMSSVKDAKWVIVTLSKKLVPLIELLQSELPAKCPTIANLEVEGKDIPVGKCIINSSVGVIDASIDEQIQNLSIRFEQVQQKRGNL